MLTFLSFLTIDWVFEQCYAPMRKTGDIFLTVSPGATNLWITDAEAAHQITSQRDVFPKSLESYRILAVFGENILTTEGNEWRKHRKVSAPGFNEKNNVMVFAESCKQTQAMLKTWLGPGGKGNITLKEVPGDVMRLTLHIISLVGFGVHLLWPGETPDSKLGEEAAVFSSNVPSGGHTMSFEHSLETLLERMVIVLLLPEWAMSKPLPRSSIISRTNIIRTNPSQNISGLVRIPSQLASVYERTYGPKNRRGSCW
jgi:hypothetical protein